MDDFLITSASHFVAFDLSNDNCLALGELGVGSLDLLLGGKALVPLLHVGVLGEVNLGESGDVDPGVEGEL
jgi:hypothetical protein